MCQREFARVDRARGSGESKLGRWDLPLTPWGESHIPQPDCPANCACGLSRESGTNEHGQFISPETAGLGPTHEVATRRMGGGFGRRHGAVRRVAARAAQRGGVCCAVCIRPKPSILRRRR